MILIVYAHPYPRHSRVNRAMIDNARALPDVEIRTLYDLYPDFRINVGAEQRAIERAGLVVLQCPMQWYSIPPLLKLWVDKVLEHGWAYGDEGTALRGKDCLWAVTTGGDLHHFDLGDHPGFAVLAQPLQSTMVYCGMNWLPPFAVHNTFEIEESTILQAADAYAERLRDWQRTHVRVPAEDAVHG